MDIDKPQFAFSCSVVQHDGKTYRAYDIGGFTVFYADTECFTFPWGMENRVCVSALRSEFRTTLFICAYPFFQAGHDELEGRELFPLLQEVRPLLKSFKQQHPAYYESQINL